MPFPPSSSDRSGPEIDRMQGKATTASNFLKAISHEGRLMILCHLVSGEKSVTDRRIFVEQFIGAVSVVADRGG